MTRDDRGRTDMGDETPRDNRSRDDGARPLDLSALKDGRTVGSGGGGRGLDAPDRWEVLARRIEAAAAPELARRAARARLQRGGGAPELLLAIARASRPALLALAASAMFALALSRASRAPSSPTTAPVEPTIGQVAEVSVAQALRVDEPAASWILQQRAPNADDLARAIDPEAAK